MFGKAPLIGQIRSTFLRPYVAHPVAVRNAIPMRSWCEHPLEFYRTIANYASYPRYHQSGLEYNLASGSYAQRDALLVKRYKRLGWINLSFVSKGRLKTIEILVRILMYLTFYLVWINITKHSRCLNGIPKPYSLEYQCPECSTKPRLVSLASFLDTKCK